MPRTHSNSIIMQILIIISRFAFVWKSHARKMQCCVYRFTFIYHDRKYYACKYVCQSSCNRTGWYDQLKMHGIFSSVFTRKWISISEKLIVTFPGIVRMYIRNITVTFHHNCTLTVPRIFIILRSVGYDWPENENYSWSSQNFFHVPPVSSMISTWCPE